MPNRAKARGEVKAQTKYAVSEGDMKRIEELLDADAVVRAPEGGIGIAFDGCDETRGFESAKSLLKEMAEAAVSWGGDSFAEFAFFNKRRIREAAAIVPEVVEVLVLGYRHGIADGSGACMNDLGALYYMGDLVGQDYAKAAELYEMAADAGCYQGIINLRYIYEYGRTGAPDHIKAYQWYSLAAALAPSCEAVYKLGDMFSRGTAVARNMKKAYRLYERSLELARDDAERAQPAVRIARMLIDPECFSYGAESNPLRALSLFQQAEIGLRIDIAAGQTHYAKRLQEAIEGQVKARELIDVCGIDSYLE